MLPKVVGPVELLAGIALAEFVDILEMANPLLPVLVGDAGVWPVASKLLSAVSARVGFTRCCRAVVEGPLVARQG